MMLATTAYANRYTKSRIYENNWIDNHSIRIPWLNFLTAQSIPEETDVIDCPKRIPSDSDCSSSSIEDFYVVLEVQQPRSIDETKSIIEKKLNFAQINEDKHHIEYEQLAQSMIIEVPLTENAIEHQSEQLIINKENVKMTQLVFHTPKRLEKSIIISNDHSPNITRRKPDQSIDTFEQESINHRYSITSLDSLEHNSHISNPIQTQQKESTFKTTTLTRTFAFDRVCMEKSDRVKEQNINDAETYIEGQSILPFYLNNKGNNPSPFFRLIKKHTRSVKSEYHLCNNEIKINDPLLFQMKYLDGRPTLTDFNALELLQKSQLLTNSIYSRLSTSKISPIQDLSYRKRILNRVQTFFKSTSNDQSKPWQQKTIFELFNGRKNKTNYQ